MPNEEFWSTIGAILGQLPPEFAGFVIIAIAGAVLAYSWRRATDEAKKERAKAENSTAALSDHMLRSILATVNATSEHVSEIKTDVAILKDRKR
jgi:hypothetical protein